MKQFLIVKTSAIGDVIQSFHSVDYLKKHFPDCTIDWVVEKGIAPLLKAHPHLDRVLEVDTKKWRKAVLANWGEINKFRKSLRQKNYDVLFDLQGNTKSGILTALAKAKQKVGYSWSSVPEKPNILSTNVHLKLSKEGSVRKRYSELLEGYFGLEDVPNAQPLELSLNSEEESRLEHLTTLGLSRPRLMICFGSNWKNKMLSEETLKTFLHLIDEKLTPTFFFIYGNESEKRIARDLENEFPAGHAIGEMSLPLWQRLMSAVDGVIAMDSAALHLCATTTTPTFSLFGPSSALAYKPLGENHHAFQGGCPYNVQFDKRCPRLRTCETGACLKAVSAQDLFDHFQNFWAKVSERGLVKSFLTIS